MATIPAVPSEKDPTKVSFAQAVVTSLGELNSETGAQDNLKNGSFEDVSSGEPLLWDISDSAGGSHQISNATESGGEAHHGIRSLQITTTGLGGFADALNSIFLPVGEGNTVLVAGFVRRDTAAIRKRVQILYYDENESLVATDNVDDDSGSGTTYVLMGGTSDAPSGALFYKVKLIGGESGGVVGGNVFFDGFQARVLLRPLELDPVIYDAAGASTYTVPAGVNAVHITVAGGGGGGGGAPGGGGGGAGFIVGQMVEVSPGDILSTNVGAAGTGGTAGNDGTDGGVSWVGPPASNFVNRFLSGSDGNGGKSGSGTKAGGTGWNTGANGAVSVGGAGADHVYGTGGAGGGNDATGNCAGGGGADASGAGGDGAPGYIIITPHLH